MSAEDAQVPATDTSVSSRSVDTNCKFDVSVDVDWGTRDDGNLDVPANFTVSANGVSLLPAGGSGSTKTYASTGGALTATAGPTTSASPWHARTWVRHPLEHTWNGQPCIDPPASATSPCKYGPVAEDAHRTFVGVNSYGNARATRRQPVRSSLFTRR